MINKYKVWLAVGIILFLLLIILVYSVMNENETLTGWASLKLPTPDSGTISDSDIDGITDDLDKCPNTIADAPVYGQSYPEAYWGCIKGDLSHDGKICFDDHTKYLTKFFQYFNKQINIDDFEGLVTDIKQDNMIQFDDHTAYLTNFFKYFGCQ